ncbi:MAG TPA: hypothetical protein DD850_02245 [Erwinia persicina]|uniref:Uncharacterized protein n=1 Tax=Erwinia persicina TaxID=55211 RepID=A0A3S7S8F4_9GAMM|nr:hypothetical protein CI789_18450 [Erwinia persicina]TKJ87670.1 hypothetical protein EpCFBP13511_16845 [Erwinia persicina]HBH66206.1 hypothetical protein [Erwinia persicina]HBH68707.1 hypothetical protein [Erwinia persicina]HBI06451.1 hypothetical protein [Erwinia persicina]
MSKTFPRNFIVSIPMNSGNGLLCLIYRRISTCMRRPGEISTRLQNGRNRFIFPAGTPDSE